MSANKFKDNILEGQINLFDLPIQEIIKPKDPVTKCVPKQNNFNEIISLYQQSCNRIVKRVSGALLIELEDRTLYFNKQGINEFELGKEVGLLPADEILIVNKDKELNDLQLKKLEDMHMEQYIKRKGDANIIIPFKDKTVVINPKGWVLEYLQKPKYHENELFSTEMDKKISVLDNENTEMAINITKSVNESTKFENSEDEKETLQNGDTVTFNYDGPQKGEIVSIYNNGETVNVSWGNKRTAFYYKCVKKIS